MIKLFNDNCLDVMRSQDFLNLTKDRKVIVVTDPPFNVGYHYNEYKDNLPDSEMKVSKAVLRRALYCFKTEHKEEYEYLTRRTEE